MDTLKITIKEKEKLSSSFNLFNLRDEVVNFMYKKTVADSSRQDMAFYVLCFFLSIRLGSKTLLEDLLDNNVAKLTELNRLLLNAKKLRKGQYAQFVEQAGLTRAFQFDVFFLLMLTILNSDDVLIRFKTFFTNHPQAQKDFLLVVNKYKNSLQEFNVNFDINIIVNDTVDYNGEPQEVSRSVTRMIVMRTSRGLDLNLHKYAEVKDIKSRSPIILEIIQHIHPEILTNIWQTYKLDEYAKNIWNFSNQPLTSNIATAWLTWRMTKGTDKKGKAKARTNYDNAKKNLEKTGQENDLLESLTRSVLASNGYLRGEVKRLTQKKNKLEANATDSLPYKKEIDDLEKRIKRLENIEIKVRKEK